MDRVRIMAVKKAMSRKSLGESDDRGACGRLLSVQHGPSSLAARGTKRSDASDPLRSAPQPLLAGVDVLDAIALVLERRRVRAHQTGPAIGLALIRGRGHREEGLDLG